MSEFNRTDRRDMIWQIMMVTRYTEEALVKLTDEKLIELYKAKVQ
ncbi:hypothetical protein [Lederbergia lenta]|nr:hypothetical protein [Lederbergia lenta]